jgi:hypothetical protein
LAYYFEDVEMIGYVGYVGADSDVGGRFIVLEGWERDVDAIFCILRS